ncbi:S-adenosyl-L-methionine-dependent methyltransferase [Trametes elegans]|nr:S-adenosyl-L-methionine-dependent methyltransferase [Trametes elegans]
MSLSILRALHGTIGNAIDDLDRLYRERSQSDVALEPPLLDVPFYPSAPHSAYEELAEKLTADPAVAHATRQILAACGQMSATAQLAACIRFMEAAHIVDILRERGPNGLHAREICRLVAELRPEGAQPDPSVLTPARLSHILRVLATAHWLREVAPDVFANNRRSAFLDSGKTLEQLRAEPEKKYVDTNGAAALAGMVTDDMYKMVGYLTEWILPDQRIGPARTVDAKGNANPHGTTKAEAGVTAEASTTVDIQPRTTFSLAFGTKLPIFDWMELPENNARLSRFGHAMLGTRGMETENEVLRGFSWADLPPDSVLVDVGGGIGSTSMTVARAHPHIRVVVEDRPQVTEGAPSSWGPKYAPLIETGRISWRARDMFTEWTPLPARKVPDVFLVRIVLHDWPDAEAQLILSRLRSAAGPNTKLLIGDILLPYACKTEGVTSLVPDGSPLLPNLGMANLHEYLVDISMLSIAAAQERTEHEMANLTLAAGWKVVEVRRSPGSLWAYTTAVPV